VDEFQTNLQNIVRCENYRNSIQLIVRTIGTLAAIGATAIICFMLCHRQRISSHSGE
jgi:hypothetical protein